MTEILILSAVGVILVATLSPLDMSASGSGWNLTPFRDLLASRSRFSTQLAIADLIRNVALYVPLGVALAMRFPRLWIVAIACGAGALSSLVEQLQGTTAGRVSDITDVLMNTLGAAVGVVIVRAVSLMARDSAGGGG